MPFFMRCPRWLGAGGCEGDAMNRARRGYLGILLLLLLVIPLACKAERGNKADAIAKEAYWGNDETRAGHMKLLGETAPAVDLTDWQGGPVTAGAMKGKIVVIDFWATWCPPCKKAVPHNNELAKKYADKGVLVVGACGGGQEEKMNDVVAETKMEYPTGKATEETTKAWGVPGWPRDVAVVRQGTSRAAGIAPRFFADATESHLQTGGRSGG